MPGTCLARALFLPCIPAELAAVRGVPGVERKRSKDALRAASRVLPEEVPWRHVRPERPAIFG
eukprot:scaffold304994_cov18-Tisochrysis_lutea.AAC.2